MPMNLERATPFTSPIGRGRRVAPGEEIRSIVRPYPLAPTLSQSKSDLSDFDRLEMPNSGKPELGERERPSAAATRRPTFSEEGFTLRKRSPMTAALRFDPIRLPPECVELRK